MDDFDPYLKWLGIRETQRPVNHYRLLGLDLYESDADVISTAADRQMAHVRTYQSGARGELSQEILSELAIARRCLLVPEQKQNYDAQLRQSETEPLMAQPVSAAAPLAERAIETPPPPSPSIAVKADSSHREQRQKRANKQMTMNIVGWIGGGLGAVVVCAVLMQLGLIPGLGKKSPDDERLVKKIDSETGSVNGKDSTPKFHPSKNRVKNDPNKNQLSQADSKNRDTQKSPNQNTQTINDPSHPDFKWKRGNLRLYPAPTDVAKNLLNLVSTAIAAKKFHRFEASNVQGGDFDYQILSGKHLLVGLALSQDQDGTIRTIAPLQLGKKGIRFGQEYGQAKDKGRNFLLAKPGYAVGEIEVSTEHPMKCVRLVYMKIQGDRLDTKDQYTSEWYPKMIRPITRIRNTVGLPLAGMHGRYQRGSHVSTLGIIGALTHDNLGVVAVLPTERQNTVSPPGPDSVPNENTATASPKPDKASAPSESDLKTARTELAVLYEQQLRSAEPNARLLNAQSSNVRDAEIRRARNKGKELADLLGRDVVSEADQPIMQFAMYLEIAEIGVSLGDLKIVMGAMREIDRRYEIEFWRLIKSRVKATAANTTNGNSSVFRRDLDELIEQAITEQRFKEAEGLVDWAADTVRRTDPAQADRYRKHGRMIGNMKKVQTANERALKTIESEPDNPKANQDRGTFEFAIEENVKLAMTFWSKSSDKQLLNLVKLHAETDRESPSSLMVLAETWRDMGSANRTYQDRRFLEKAIELLESATNNAEGLEKRRIDQMIKETKDKIDE